MKLILNIISILASISWFVFWGINSVGKFGSLHSQNSYLNKVSSFVFLSPIIVSIVFVILSRVIKINKLSIILAIIPFVWILICYFILVGVKTKNAEKFSVEQKEGDKQIELLAEKMSVFSHDYVCKTNSQEGNGILDEFFTYKKEKGTMAYIKITHSNYFDIRPLGKIDGNNFELFYNITLPDCRDANNKTIFDNYNVVYKEGQEEKDYNLAEYYDVAEEHVFGEKRYSQEL